MNFRNLIRERVLESSFNLYDREGRPVDPAEFREKYRKVRAYVAAHVPPGRAVAIHLPKDPDYLLAMLACMDCGRPYIPTKDSFPAARLDQIRAQSGFALLLDDALFATIVGQPALPFDETATRAEQALYVIFTSGSTGAPKGVEISHAAALNFCAWLDRHFDGQIGADDRVLQVTDFTFDISLIDVFLFLTKNAHLHFSDGEGNAFTLAYEVGAYGITVLNTVPNNVSTLLDPVVFGRADLTSLRTLLVGGAKFSRKLHERMAEVALPRARVHNFYGPTECTIYSHIKKIDFDEGDHHAGNISIGTPVDGVTALVWAGDRPVDQSGERGELLLGGRQVMTGYLNDEAKTAAAFVTWRGERFYRTGDLAMVSGRGEYHVLGRLDDTVKHRGYRINLSDIDCYVAKLPYVNECATVAVPDEAMENKTVAFLRVSGTPCVKEVRRDLGDILLAYQIPCDIRLVTDLPLNENGKVCKKTLRTLCLNPTPSEASG